MKKEIRVLGVDDSPFAKYSKKNTLVIGTVYRGGEWLDGIISTKVRIDGNNATSKLIEMINNTKFKPQLQCIFLDGIAFGGFNVIDITELNKKTRIPVVVVIRKKPDIDNIKQVLIKINKKNKIMLIDKAGEPVKIGKIFVQFKGMSLDQVKNVLKITCTRSLIPEPIRTAHLIAQGIYFGESKGRA
ncbi:MAG: DUF99 family protein [Nanoarchaeota archaeon]